ncbi:MAG: ParB N-terminal domain-containing protein [Candidatus Dormibacteraeota bacterium]|nr:ParB N-terminal domain-containing protein [Candidatus Dormibacteraeota bacterium]
MKQLRAHADFETARIHAFLRDAGSVLRGDTRPLLSFDEVRRAARLEGQSYCGLKDVPIADIRGSVGRPNDFDASFLPVKPQMRKRWADLDAAMRRGEAMPPIEVYHLGDVYFVKDGHHRVSVARHLGWKTIPARVIEVKTRAPLSGDMDAAALLQAREYVDFLERTQLDRVRPEASIAVSRLGRYDRIFEDILGHRYFLGLQQYREVGMAEASASWYDNVYKPIADLIREYDILAHFPGRTEADLYLWITARWLELSRAQKPSGPEEAVADILFETEGAAAQPPSPQVMAVLQRWLGPPRRVIELPAKLIRRATTARPELAGGPSSG